MQVSISLRMGDLGHPKFTGSRMGDHRYQVSLDEDERIFTHISADEAVIIAAAWAVLAGQLGNFEQALAHVPGSLHVSDPS